MDEKTKVTVGEYVQFSYRKNPTIELTRYVVSILENTIVVDISEMIGSEILEVDDVRQVVKHGSYNKLVDERRRSNES